MTGKIMFSKIKGLWQNIRRLSGDDAYERYLQHYLQHQAEQHAEDAEPEKTMFENSLPPLSREEFFKQWQDKKWKGIKRCC